MSAPELAFGSLATDAVLLDRLQARDAIALKELHQRHAAFAHSVAYRVLGRSDDAEEVVQEVFLELWVRGVDFDPRRARFRTWLFTVTRNRAVDRRRSLACSSKRWTRVAIESSSDRLGAVVSPETAVSLREQQQVVQHALEALSTEYRQALELSYFEGFSHSEIADRVGEPVGTIKSRIRRAMEKLRTDLSSGILGPRGGGGCQSGRGTAVQASASRRRKYAVEKHASVPTADSYNPQY